MYNISQSSSVYLNSQHILFIVLLHFIRSHEHYFKEELTKYMKQEFSSKQTDVANVIKMFGPQRLTKCKDESASDHYFRWFQNIPEIMKPTDEASRKDFVDLIMRAMYFVSLEDEPNK